MIPRFCVCLTCVGGRYMYGIISALRAADDFQVELVGVDANSNSSGMFLANHFEVVPMAEQDEAAYVRRMLSIGQKYALNLIIPGSEAETRVIAKHRRDFDEAGIISAVNAYETVGIMTDKLTMLSYLRERGVDTGDFLAVNSLEDAQSALTALQYPAKCVVFKQRQGTGSRGILIADAAKSEFQPLLAERFCGTGSFEVLCREMEKEGVSFAQYLAMPYYGEEAYDVDCLSVQGGAVEIIPRLRQYKNPLSPFNEGCKIVRHEGIVEYVRKVCRAFGVHGACDFDIALDIQGNPKLLDASSRMSGSVGAAVAAGVNIPAQAIRIMMNLPLKNYDFPDGAVLRPVHHIIKV